MIPLVIDIETRADRLFLDSEGVEEMLRDTVKTGNAKKLDVVAEKREEGVLKMIERAALSPLTGRVAVISAAPLHGNLPVRSFYRDTGNPTEDERDTIREFFDHILTLNKAEGRPVICGFGVRTFDIPFITQRACILGIEVPLCWPTARDYKSVCDVNEALNPTFAKGLSLDVWLRRFALAPKTAHGSDVERMSQEQAVAYCENDVRVERELVLRCLAMFPTLRYEDDV